MGAGVAGGDPAAGSSPHGPESGLGGSRGRQAGQREDQHRNPGTRARPCQTWAESKRAASRASGDRAGDRKQAGDAQVLKERTRLRMRRLMPAGV